MKITTKIATGIAAGALALTALTGTAFAAPFTMMNGRTATPRHMARAATHHARHHARRNHRRAPGLGWMMPGSRDTSGTIPTTGTVPGYYGGMMPGWDDTTGTVPATGTAPGYGGMMPSWGDTTSTVPATMTVPGYGGMMGDTTPTQNVPAPGYGMMSGSF
jgi:hypothetical protein